MLVLAAFPFVLHVCDGQEDDGSPDDLNTGGDESLSKKSRNFKWGGCCCGGAMTKMCPPADVKGICEAGGGQIVDLCTVANADTCCQDAIDARNARDTEERKKNPTPCDTPTPPSRPDPQMHAGGMPGQSILFLQRTEHALNKAGVIESNEGN